MAVMMLHWCLGFGAAVADVLCLEPDGNAVVEQQGQPCPGAPFEKAMGQPCVDLAMDDGHATDEPAPAKPMQPPPLPALLPVLAFFPLLEPPPLKAFVAPPPSSANSHPAALRATTVLRI